MYVFEVTVFKTGYHLKLIKILATAKIFFVQFLYIRYTSEWSKLWVWIQWFIYFK